MKNFLKGIAEAFALLWALLRMPADSSSAPEPEPNRNTSMHFIKTLQNNWKELVIGVLGLALLVALILLVGSREVAENRLLSSTVAALLRLVIGAVSFITVAILAWWGNSITFPEGNKHIMSEKFDAWWENETPRVRGLTALTGVAVLFHVGALLMH